MRPQPPSQPAGWSLTAAGHETEVRRNIPLDESFQEEDYLALYPDVRAAVESGAFRSGYEHYERHGRAEGRSPASVPMRLKKLAEASSAMERCARVLGEPVPAAPGLRGWIGGIAMRIFERLLGPHLAQLQQFGRALAERDRAQIDLLRAADQRIEQISSEIRIFAERSAERDRELELAQLTLQSAQLKYATGEEIERLAQDLEAITAQLKMVSRNVTGVQARTGATEKVIADLRRKLDGAAYDPVNGHAAPMDPELAKKVQSTVEALKKLRGATPAVRGVSAD